MSPAAIRARLGLPTPPERDAQGRRLSPYGAVLPAWYPDLATRRAVLGVLKERHP